MSANKRVQAVTSQLGRPLEGKNAVVTGSTSGIGLAIAQQLARAGCNVLLNGFGDAAAIETLRKTVEADFNVKAFYHGADLSKESGVNDMMKFAYEKLGSVDILVNNAGIQFVAPIESFPSEKYQQVMAINLHSVFYAMKAAVPHMKKAGYGRIINISSVHGLVASKDKSAYVATKHGVVGLTKTVALECAGTGVTVNCINPGWVRTPLVEMQIEARAKALKLSIEEAAKNLLAEKQPSKQFSTPDQLGDLAVFLCGQAASQITGICIPMDGGWTAQ